MRFELEYLNGKTQTVDDVLSFELVSSVSSACDGLRLYFSTEAELPAVFKVTVFDDEKKLFFGYADVQKTSESENGLICFIYARSSACLLLDNEAEPTTLTKPTTNQLFECFASEFGFKNRLPDIGGESYLISKSTSCYGALHDFVFQTSGKRIFVNPENEIRIYENDVPFTIKKSDVLRVSHTIERGAPVSNYYYKINSSEGYCRRADSKYFENLSIKRRRYINLSAYPFGQREQTLKRKMAESASGFDTLELTVSGMCQAKLLSAVQFDFEMKILKNSAKAEYELFEKVILSDIHGVKTRLRLRKRQDLQEVMYVAE